MNGFRAFPAPSQVSPMNVTLDGSEVAFLELLILTKRRTLLHLQSGILGKSLIIMSHSPSL